MSSAADAAELSFSPRFWAAYVVGRYPFAIASWQHAFHSCTLQGRSIDQLLALSPQLVSLGAPFDDFPLNLFEDLYEALQILAAEGVIKSYVLLEIYRRLDQSEAACAELVRTATEGLDALDASTIWSEMSPTNRAIELLKAVIPDDPQTKSWMALGAAVGEWADWIHFGGGPPEDDLFLPRLDRLLSRFDGGAIGDAAAHVVELEKKLRDLPHGITFGEVMGFQCEILRAFGALDGLLLDRQRGDVAEGLLLVVDKGQQKMIFLGVQFPFGEFPSNAAGGLKCFIFLAERAGDSYSHDKIIEGAGLVVEPDRLPEYLSRFRKWVRSATDPFSAKVRGELARNARMAFIVGSKKKRGAGKQGQYKLAIERSRVEIRD